MPHPRITPEEGAAMAEAYIAGSPLLALEYRFGWSTSAIRAELIRRGIPRRPKSRQPVEGSWERWVSQYALGMSTAAVAHANGVTPASVRYALLRMGITLRPRGSGRIIDRERVVEMTVAGMSSPEIAREFGVTASAIRAKRHRARRDGLL